MRSIRILLFLLVGVGLTWVVACPQTEDPQPADTDGNQTAEDDPIELVPGFPVDRYRGRALDEWIADIESGDRFKCFKAIVAVGEMEEEGELAVPAIQKILDDPKSDQGLRTKAIATLGRVGGQRAQLALKPTMIGSDDVLGILSADAYGAMGSSAVGAILPYLDSDSADVRFRAVRALHGVLRTDGKVARMETAVVPLAHCLADTDQRVQADALQVLSELGPRAYEAKSAIIEQLRREERNETKKILMVMLGGYGSDAIDAIDVLRENLANEDEQVQLFAALAVSRIGQLEEGLPPLIAFLQSSDPQLRLAAADALRRIGPPAKDAIEPLKQARKGADDPMHVMIEQALKSIRQQ